VVHLSSIHAAASLRLIDLFPDPQTADQRILLRVLWDLEQVNQSHDAAGMNAGKVHHPGMLGAFGGRQSEMSRGDRPIVQLCFRSTYSLNYQPFRRSQAGEISLCEDIDAYEVKLHLPNLPGQPPDDDGWVLGQVLWCQEEVRGSWDIHPPGDKKCLLNW